MFRKVLVPLDGSELARAVLPYVEELGRQCAAEAILLRVIPPPGNGAGAAYQSLQLYEPMAPAPEMVEDMTAAQHPIYRDQEIASLHAQAEQSLTDAKERLIKAGLQVRTHVLFGRPADKIVEYALEEQVTVIAMATHGHSGFRRWVFGSVAEKVLRAIAIPILLIRPPGADKHIRLPGVNLAL